MEEFKFRSEEEIAKDKVMNLEDEFQKLSEADLSDAEFYVKRSTIDKELSEIFDKFPHLEEWNNNRL